MTAQSWNVNFPYGPGTTSIPWNPQPQPYRPLVQFAPETLLTKVRAIHEMLTAKTITRTEARKMLAALDPSFAAILRSK
jgi:hypothetical protein